MKHQHLTGAARSGVQPGWEVVRIRDAEVLPLVEKAGQALAGLTQLQQSGFFKDPVRLKYLKHDTIFDPLRARADFQKLAAEPDFQMLTLDRLAQDLRICADGKLIDCVDKSWEPLLRSVKRPNGVTRIRYPVKAARIGGTVQITL